MAENLGGKFATMSEDERRRFAMEQEPEREGRKPKAELEFEDPRQDHARTKADLEDRDGAGAQLDDAQHAERVRQEARARSKSPRPPE
jgi:hypothetical protein